MRSVCIVLVGLVGSMAAAAVGCHAGHGANDASNAAIPAPVSITGAHVEHDAAGNATVTAVADSPHAVSVLAQRDRAPEDRATDRRRQAADVLTYLDVQPGMHVVELGAGEGYFTEILARAVGPEGMVYGENPPSLVDRTPIRDAWDARLKHPAGTRIARVDHELGAPLPAHGLDLVYLGLDYRDLTRVGVERSAVDGAVFVALRAGGRYIVVDRRAVVPNDDETRSARREIEAAGFRFVSEGRFLHHDTDPRDWAGSAVADPKGLEPEERVFLTFAKP